MSTRHKFLKILIFVVSTLIAGNTWSATCDERWPSPEFYFDNGGVTPIDNEDGTFDYDITINLVVTKPPAGGGSLSFELFGERYTGSATFRAFGVERRQAQVRMFLDGQPIGQKKIVYEGEFGLILPPAPSFTTQLVGNRLTAMNTSANTNGVFILYTWDFDLQARPSIVQEFDPPEVIYPQTPGTYCVRLWAQERSRFGGQAFDPLDQNYAAYYEVAIEEDAPIAAFDTDVLGRLARFDNTSSHPALKAMSYSWDFGDGTVSTAENPQHTYEQPGNYLVRLTATDPEGDEDTAEQDVMTEYALVIEATADDQLAQDVEHLVQVDVYNYERDDIDNLTLDLGLDPSFIEQEGIARPGVLKLLGKDQSFTTYYTIVPRAAGDTTITLTGQGDLVAGGTAQAAVDLPVSVLPDVTVSISAPSVQAAGEEVTVTLTVTNNEDFSLDGIRTDSLVITPTTLLTRLSGPVGPNGQDPRVNPLSLGPGETTTITWTYRTEGTGVIDLNAVMSFNQVNGEGRFSRSAQTRFAVDTAALELRQLRMSGGPPPPGSFTLLRGQIANVGNYDVTGIDFLLAGSQPRITHLERLVSELSPDISPRIARLVPGEVREFIIPIGVQLDVGSASRYTLPVQFSGIAEVGGEDVDVIIDTILRDDLDRSRYWVDILDEVRSLLVNNV
ncbi:MAG: PKD domain-containing protein, partial [Pseudomonadota bacterium]